MRLFTVKISIAMATYNGEKYLREQLDSILVQTYTEWELIVCDDCSGDETVKILEEYAQKDNRIKVYVNEQNLGFKKNFEKAISLCTGEYIALSDQDDVWTKDHLRYLFDNIGECDISCANAEIIDGNGISKNIRLNACDLFFCKYKENLLLYRLVCTQSPFQGASMLIKKSFLESFKVLPIPEGVYYHDAWFSVCAALNHGISYSFDKIITKYRQHGNNVTSHEKFSIIKTVFNNMRTLFKSESYTTDRLCYIKEINSRFNLSVEQKDILEECKMVITARFSSGLRNKLLGMCIFLKRYKYIMATDTNDQRLLRTMKMLISKGDLPL